MTPEEIRENPNPSSRRSPVESKQVSKIQLDATLSKELQTRFNLSPEEAGAYTSLLIMGQLAPDQIRIYSGLPVEAIDPVIKSLLDKNLIKVMPGVVKRYRAFAPYKELAEGAIKYYTDTKAAQEELQGISEQVIKEVHSQMQVTSKKIRTQLEDWNERQKTIFKEAATVTKTVLKEVAGNLQQTLKELADSSYIDLTTQSASTQESLQTSIDYDLEQLEESHIKTLEKVQNTIQEQQIAAEKWLKSVTSNLLQGFNALADRFITQISDSYEAIQLVSGAGVTSTTTDITARTEQAQQQIQDTIAAIDKQLQTFKDEQDQTIDNWQKEITISITRIIQDTNQHLRTSWSQRLQAFEQLAINADKTLQRTGRQLSKATERTAADTESLLQTGTQTFSQIGDELAQEIQNAIAESVQGYQRLQKDIETAIANWPPSALTFSQYSKIKEALPNVANQFAQEYEGLLESIVKTLGIDMRDVHLSQLMDIRTILENLGNEVAAHQKALTTSIETISSGLEKTINRRLKAIQKTANSFIKDFQTKIQLQGEQGTALGRKAQTRITKQGAKITDMLIKANKQLETFIQERLEPAHDAIEDLARTNITKISKFEKAFQKPINSFKATTKKEIREINQLLNQELDQLQSLIKQYADGVESTGDKLLKEQILQSETALKAFKTAIEKQHPKRNRSITRALRSAINKIKRNRQAEFDSLKQPIQDAVAQHATAALSAYHTSITKLQPALQEQATTTFLSTLKKRVQKELLSFLSQSLQKTLSTQKKRSLARYQETASQQKSTFNKEIKSELQKIRNQFTEIQQTHVSKMTEATEEEISKQIEALFRVCRTKVYRQTRRDKQIDRAFQTTLDQLKQLHTTILPNLSKSKQNVFLKELEKIMSTCKTQIARQTQRDKQIDRAFQTTLDQLKQLPTTILPPLLDPLIADQNIELQTALIDSLSRLETLQNTQTEKISERLQNYLAEVTLDSLVKPIQTPLQNAITQHATAALSAYHTSITKLQPALQEQATTTFQTTFTEMFQKKPLANLTKLTNGTTQTLNELLNQTSQKITDIINQADADSWQLTEKHWSPLARSTEDYTTALVGNLTALNTAISTALDLVSINVGATLTGFQDKANTILENTIQEFTREQKSMTERVILGITETKEGCLSNITEARTLLDRLSKNLASQEANLETEIEAMTTELGAAVTTNFEIIHETADAFIQDYQRKIQLQTDQIQNLKKKAKTLLLREGTKTTNILTAVKKQLSKFNQNQISQAQTEIEELEATCTTRIDDHRSVFRRAIESFVTHLSEESEDYISSLQEEIKQLQKDAMDLSLKVGETGETLNTRLSMRIETGMLNFQTAIGEQRSKLDTQISPHFAELKDNFEKIHTDLIEKQTRETQAGRLALEEALKQVNLMLENSILQTDDQSGTLRAEQKKALGRIINNHSAMVTERLETINAEITAGLNQAIQTVTAILTDTKEDTGKILETTTRVLNQETNKFTTNLTKEETQTLNTFTQSLDLTNTRVSKAAQDLLRRATEILRTTKETAISDIQQQGKSVRTTIKQFINSTEEVLTTQPKKAGQLISRTLRKEQKQLRLESQSYFKEILAEIQEAEVTSIQPFENFIQKLELPLESLQKHVNETGEFMLGLWNTLAEFQVSEAERTWYIVSSESIYNHLQDMLRRTNSTITLVYPSFEEVPLNQLATMSPEKRIHLITSVDGEKHQSKVNKLLKQGNVRLWQSPLIQFYGGTRDGEEVLIAPVHDKPSETVAVVSDQLSYVALFNQTLGPRWLAASKEIIRKESVPD